MFGFHGFCLFVLKAEINIRSGVSQKWQKKNNKKASQETHLHFKVPLCRGKVIPRFQNQRPCEFNNSK